MRDLSCAGRSLLTAAFLVTLSTACAARDAAPRHGAASDEAILDGRTGEALEEAAVIERLTHARVVYVGERHDHPGDHAVQARIVDALSHGAEAGGEIGVGLEMVQRPFQPGLDAWLAGQTDEDALLTAVEWSSRWGWDFAFYRPVFERMRAVGGRLIALNAPAEVSRAVGRGGLEALDEETRDALPELDLGDPDHRAMITAALGGHGHGHGGAGGDDGEAPEMPPEMLERFYTAQVVWDETMAETVAGALDGAPRLARMIVLAGRFHVQAGLGIPKRAARRGATPYLVVLPIGADERDLVDPDRPAADVLWVTTR